MTILNVTILMLHALAHKPGTPRLRIEGILATREKARRIHTKSYAKVIPSISSKSLLILPIIAATDGLQHEKARAPLSKVAILVVQPRHATAKCIRQLIFVTHLYNQIILVLLLSKEYRKLSVMEMIRPEQSSNIEGT